MFPKLSAGLRHPAAPIGVRLKGSGRGRAIGTESGQGVEPVLDVRRTLPSLDDVPFREQGGQVAGQIGRVVPGSPKQHMAQARMGGERGHFFAKRGDVSLAVQGAEGEQHRLRLGEMGGRGRVEQAQCVRFMHPPAGQIQNHLAQVGAHDLRRVKGLEGVVLAHAPQPIAVPRAEASGPPGPLGGRGVRDALGGQPAQAAVGVELRAPFPAAVHHGVDALDGDAGFGNGGGQDDAPFSLRVRLHRSGLGRQAQVAVQGMDDDFG